MNRLNRLSKWIAPTYVGFALIAPALISAFTISAFGRHQFAWLDAQSNAVNWTLLNVHHFLLSFGISLGLLTFALATYGWTPARRAVHLVLLLVSIELFYQFAYGGAISPAVLLAVVETNPRETGELLSGHVLLTACLLCVVFLSFYALGASWKRGARISSRRLLQMGVISIAFVGAGIVIGYQEIHESWKLRMVVFEEMKDVFPLDFARSLLVVSKGALKTRQLAAQRASFTFPGVRLADGVARADQREIYVVIVGETSRRANWSLFGYSRATTPRLDEIKDRLFKFGRATANATTTSVSVPISLMRATHGTLQVSRSERSVVSLLKEAGFATYWISNQEHFGPFANSITAIANEADHVSFPNGAGANGDIRNDDSNLLSRLDNVLETMRTGSKVAVFLHMYGSHWNYTDRYPLGFGKFPDGSDAPRVLPRRQAQLVDEYDNSVLFSDYVIRQVIDRLANSNCNAGLIYFSDHGERLFDAGVDDFGHGFPIPTRQEIEVPLMLWLSDTYRQTNSAAVKNLEQNAQSTVQLNNVFETIVDLAKVQYDKRDASLSLFSGSYAAPSVLEVLDTQDNVLRLAVTDAH
jgi:glucan phosphoethanolaminetransferase (alkaline phosphatase superfamily)